jgi:hypothetical protein
MIDTFCFLQMAEEIQATAYRRKIIPLTRKGTIRQKQRWVKSSINR